jgi:hypothetical protein
LSAAQQAAQTRRKTVIGRSEEKLRPKSIFLRRIVAKYVVWVEVIGYLIVVAFVVGLVFASTKKAEDEFLVIPCEVTLSADVLRADKSAEIVSLQPAGTPAGNREGLALLEESPALVTRTSLLQNLKRQLDFARSQNQEAIAADVAKMIADAQKANNAAPARRPVLSKISGQWYPTADSGDVIASGAVLGVVLNPAETEVTLNKQDPAVSKRGNRLKPDQPATITLSAGGVAIQISGKVVEGGKKDPRVRVTGIPSAEAAKIVAFYRQNPGHDGKFTGANTKVLIGEKSWASLIWK